MLRAVRFVQLDRHAAVGSRQPAVRLAYGHVLLEEGVIVQGILQGVEGSAPAIAELYPQLPLPVVTEVLHTEDLPVLTFRLA